MHSEFVNEPDDSSCDHESHNPPFSVHSIAVHVGDETTDQLQRADNEHVDFEAFSELTDGVLRCVVEAVVADLGETEYDEGNKKLFFGKCVSNLFRLILFFLLWHFDFFKRGQSVELGNIIETPQALFVLLLNVKEFWWFHYPNRHDHQDNQRDDENEQADVFPVLYQSYNRIQCHFP